ncbi:hypothetical protein HAX54_001231 [Datura stramonium]|uniref:Uncharacterized protein n=1 Tax=Datura stramonium TaxID=4076 RepID=A0ABS8T398_DATST|nr:hypothetical protein [Datura stramonium]
MVEDVPLYDSAEDEPFLVISGTSGGNEHTKILNDNEGSTFKLEPSNSTCKNYNIGSGSTTKKKSQRIPKLKVKSSSSKQGLLKEEPDLKQAMLKPSLLKEELNEAFDKSMTFLISWYLIPFNLQKKFRQISASLAVFARSLNSELMVQAITES